jgi:hypothetical protein
MTSTPTGEATLFEKPAVEPFNPIPFPVALEQERALLAALREAPNTPRVLVWRTEQALIAPSGMGAREGFAAAARRSVEAGWPVHVRHSGGDLTPQSPGIVNLSLAFRDESAPPSIARAYGRLVEPIVHTLTREWGLRAEITAVPGAFCDGTYNIAVDGRKIAGTAQRWRLVQRPEGPPAADILAHVALMCCLELRPAVAAINAFYKGCGIERRVLLDRHVTLADLIGPLSARPELVAATLARHLEALPA